MSGASFKPLETGFGVKPVDKKSEDESPKSSLDGAAQPGLKKEPTFGIDFKLSKDIG